MKAIKLTENVYWVGGIDWNLRNFHGYLTQRGSTYNAYLIIDEKITLIDTVKYYLCDEMLERISSVIDPSKINYIISNHTEMDHSGSIPMIKEIAKNAVIITSPNGEKGLKLHFKKDWEFKVVKSGDTLNIGSRNLHFYLTPMIHWPDNMVTYSDKDKILFSNDAFGQHLASSERFVKELSIDLVLSEGKKYYANIVLPYSSQVQKILPNLEKLEFKFIAPSHGVIWTEENIKIILEEYKKWSENKTENRALIIYDTMWGSTEKIAYALIQAFDEKNIFAKLYNLQKIHISDIMTDLMSAKYICVGSPTLNNNILPTVSAFLTYLKGLAPINRIGLAFGSYGWGGQSINIVNEILKSMNFKMLEPIKIQYIPTKEDLVKICDDIIRQI
ncbi:MAG TPA: FprA family A-type flavoprotein [bacterium]|nr:FprA family A-type flavoprotein [bacterium]HOL48516.1 FprA family A-type flavoprotein [bacterium]HPQ19053.1 FprA family A-type flavoprotein [bacterium]